MEVKAMRVGRSSQLQERCLGSTCAQPSLTPHLPVESNHHSLLALLAHCLANGAVEVNGYSTNAGKVRSTRKVGGARSPACMQAH